MFESLKKIFKKSTKKSTKKNIVLGAAIKSSSVHFQKFFNKRTKKFQNFTSRKLRKNKLPPFRH